MIRKINYAVKRVIRFLTYDIWRYTSNADGEKRKMGFYNVIKAFILTFRNINGSELNTRAAALTYKTVLSIVPLLAVLFGIARGFGFQNLVKEELLNYFEGQADIINHMMGMIDNSLTYAKGGVFIGVGIVLLLYTVISLFSSIEDNFNTIWRIKKGRSYYRQFTDYLALIIITPVFMICNAGLSIFLNMTTDLNVVGLVVNPIVQLLPALITSLLFTFLYIYIPNTKVKLSAALLAGVLTGIAFQVFQWLYISGQIWISQYNAIYGSFAALPLLLLWLQLSWFILLFGVELSFAFQNVYKFSFEHETKNISRRYKNFVTLLIVSLIVKRYANGQKPYTSDEISTTYKVPTRLMSDILYFLLELDVIIETTTDDVRVMAYVPAMDINILSVGYLFEKINLYGSEDFIIDKGSQFSKEWQEILKINNLITDSEKDILIKDL